MQMEDVKIIATAEAHNDGAKYTTALKVHQHNLIADELPQHGGKDLGPSPGDYLCMALASCTAITLRMYAERKGWQVENIHVIVKLIKGTDLVSGQNTFTCEVKLQGNLDNNQKNRLLQIAKACPIHRLITKPSDVVTVTAPEH